jgi:hypothetical protein
MGDSIRLENPGVGRIIRVTIETNHGASSYVFRE